MSKKDIDTTMLPLGRGTRRVSREEVRGTTHLRLRWTLGENEYVCHYELVMALDKDDIRREVYKNGEDTGKRRIQKVVKLDFTCRGSGRDPCVMWPEPHLFYDPPFRDGAHAKWDAVKLGNLPIYVVALDGTYLQEVA